MGPGDGDAAGDATLRCSHCGEIIGVYEPLVHVAGGVAHRTSWAANPHIVHARPVYHAACLELADPDLAVDD